MFVLLLLQLVQVIQFSVNSVSKLQKQHTLVILHMDAFYSPSVGGSFRLAVLDHLWRWISTTVETLCTCCICICRSADRISMSWSRHRKMLLARKGYQRLSKDKQLSHRLRLLASRITTLSYSHPLPLSASSTQLSTLHTCSFQPTASIVRQGILLNY